MKQFHSQTNLLKQLSAAVAVFISRLDILPANISPLGSFGFFGNPVLFAITIIAFDVFVKGYYPGAWLTYLGFAAYPVMGYLTRQNQRAQLIALPTASFMFFLLSNLGVWWYWYDHNIAELILCYSLAVPFYARTLASDLFFGYGYLAIKNHHQIMNYFKLHLTYAKTS